MSDYQPREGDRVRVVLEGEVTFVSSNGAFDLYAAPVFPTSPAFVSVEKVAPPLPTTPGSVLRDRPSGAIYALRGNGVWRNIEGDEHLIASEFDHWLHDIDVIFDAGEVTP